MNNYVVLFSLPYSVIPLSVTLNTRNRCIFWLSLHFSFILVNLWRNKYHEEKEEEWEKRVKKRVTHRKINCMIERLKLSFFLLTNCICQRSFTRNFFTVYETMVTLVLDIQVNVFFLLSITLCYAIVYIIINGVARKRWLAEFHLEVFSAVVERRFKFSFPVAGQSCLVFGRWPDTSGLDYTTNHYSIIFTT